MPNAIRDPSSIPPCEPGREAVTDEQLAEYVAWTKSRPISRGPTTVGFVGEGKGGESRLMDPFTSRWATLPNSTRTRHYRNPAIASAGSAARNARAA